MTVQIPIKGTILDNDMGAMYDFFDMQNTTPQNVIDALNNAGGQPVEIDISSPGGDVFAGFEIYSELKNYSGSVSVSVTGLAASAASVIAMAGDSIKMSPVAMLMIHQSQSSLQGNTDDLAHEAGVLQNIDQSIAAAYAGKTGIDQGKLLNMMSNETWMTAQESINLGFADEIMFVDDKQPVMSNATVSVPTNAALNRFKNLMAKIKPESKAKVEPVEETKITESEPKESQPADDLYASKLAILLAK